MTEEREVVVAGRVVLARDAGDPAGVPVVYLHGTPGSRLDVAVGEPTATGLGVRVISFDRPGYGGSEPAAYDLSSVAADAAAVADAHGLDRFAVLGWSGGGPFALAAAAVLGERVTRVGVSGGLAPCQERPGGTDGFTDADRAALAFLPADPAGAAEAFRAANAEMLDLMLSVRDDPDVPWMDWLWGSTDAEVLADPRAREGLRSVLREGLRQGAMAVAWDNVAWSGPWGIDLDRVRCPVHLWYGELDETVPMVNGTWLRDRLVDASLVVHEAEGHLLPLRHWSEMLGTIADLGTNASAAAGE